MKRKIDRRSFVKLTTSASGALIAGIYFKSCKPEKAQKTSYEFNALIKIDTDGWITLTAKNPEIGQGVKTALPMMLAEELGAAWDKVQVVQADFNEAYQEQWAGGSYAIILNWDLMRTAGAMVRQVLLEAASRKLAHPSSELATRDSRVFHPQTGDSIAFEELLSTAAKIQQPEAVEFKTADSFEIIGSRIPQIDGEGIVNGSMGFAIDVRVPGMVYATVLKNPVFDGGVANIDDIEARQVSGVLDVIELNNNDFGGRLIAPNSPNFVNGVAIVANSTWAAFRGAAKLQVGWDNTTSRMENTELLFARFHSQLNETTIERNDGDLFKAESMAASRLTALYEVPFLAHVPMEPMNCTVDFRQDCCEVWAPTQNPEALQQGLIKLFGLAPHQIIIHLPRIGGGFGRRYYVDYAMDAALLSKKVGRPVKLTWTREEDIRHDWFRPGSVQKLEAALDKEGTITGWRHILANASRNTSLGRDGRPGGTEIDEYEFPAGLVPNLRIEYGQVLSDVPLGQWRSVGHSATAFAVHSFFDELAIANKMDPIDFFLSFLGPPRMAPVVDDYQFDVGRLIAVVEKVRQKSHWDRPLPKGQGRGFAACKDSGTFIAEVVTVQVDEEIKILRVDVVLDCGIIINRSGAEAQVEGGILEGLCAAMYGEISIQDGAVVQSNFHDYPWMRLSEVPELKIDFIENGLPPRGLGEAPLPAAAPALANAIFAATGKRIRKLPIKDQLGPGK